MPWLVFTIFVYIAFALQLGLTTLPVWSIQTGMGPVSPDLVLLLGLYFALWAPPRTAGWVMLVLGLLVDLTTVYGSGSSPGALAGTGFTQPQGGLMTVVGPTAVAYLVGAYAVIQVRGLVYRDSWLAVVVIVGGVGALVHLVAVLLLTLRGVPWLMGQPINNWSAADQLVHRFWVLLYTAAAGGLLSFPLARIRRTWGLEPTKTGHGFRH